MKVLFILGFSILLINIPIAAQEGYFHQNSLIPHPLNDIDFINNNTGWVVGDKGTILKTNNNGTTWDLLSIGLNNRLYSVDFLNKDDGFAVGDNVILKTTDGGFNWEEKYIDRLLFFSSVNFLTDSIIFVVGGEDIYNGIILKSTDGGSNWSNLSEINMKGFFSSFFLILIVAISLVKRVYIRHLMVVIRGKNIRTKIVVIIQFFSLIFELGMLAA